MRRRPAVLPLLAALLALFLAAPFVAGLGQFRRADWTGDLEHLPQAVLVSAAGATAASLLIALGGIPLGYLLARDTGRLTAALGFLVQMPLALPPLASGILLLFLLGDVRLVSLLTDSFAGIVLAQTFVAAPFLVIAARSAFASIDPTLEDVAASLGHRPAAVFRRVSLALGWRTIAAGLLLAWLRAFGEFGATVMVAYHPYSLPVLTYVAFGGEGLPAMLPILTPTLLVALAVMALSHYLVRHTRAVVSPETPTSLASPQAVRPPADGRPLALSLHRRLDGFALEVVWHTAARRLAILGPSGSGKSLTLRIIAGLENAPDSTVRFGDRDLGRLPPEGRDIAYVPQNYGLLPHLTVAEQVRFAADADPARAAHWTARLGLRPLADRRADALSLGQQQRVALARALARPRAGLLLLDEPFSALDATLRARLRAELLSLQSEIDATTILVTHDPDEAIELADELMLLHEGRVLQSGPVAALHRRPVNEVAARLLGAESVGSGQVVAPGLIDLGSGAFLPVAPADLPTGANVGWSVRAHQVRVGPARENAIAAAIIAHGTRHDGQLRLVVQLGETVLEALADPDSPRSGPCGVSISPDLVQVWPVARPVPARR